MEAAKMRFTCLLALVLFQGAWGTTTKAESNPFQPVPDGGLFLIFQGACEDNDTKIEGFCVVTQDLFGNHYVTVMVDGEPWQIRQMNGDGYTVIWRALAGELT